MCPVQGSGVRLDGAKVPNIPYKLLILPLLASTTIWPGCCSHFFSFNVILHQLYSISSNSQHSPWGLWDSFILCHLIYFDWQISHRGFIIVTLHNILFIVFLRMSEYFIVYFNILPSLETQKNIFMWNSFFSLLLKKWANLQSCCIYSYM